MKKFLQDMDYFISFIHKRLMFIFLVPAMGLLVYTSIFLIDSYNNYQESMNIQKYSQILKLEISIIDNLQRERGATMMGVASPSFRSHIIKQRQITDKVIENFYTFLKRNKISTKYNIDIFENIQNIRKNIDKRNISPKDILEEYSLYIERLIYNILDLSRYKDIEVRDNLYQLNRLIWLAEYYGKLRGIIGVYLAKPEDISLYYLQHKRLDIESVINWIKKNTSKEIFSSKKFSELDNIFLSPKVISYIENLHKKEDKKSLEEWWNISTSAIEVIYHQEYKLLNKIQNIAYKKAVNSVIFLAIMILVFIITILLLYKFRDSIHKVIKIIKSLFDELKRQDKIHQTLSNILETILHTENENIDTILIKSSKKLYESGFYKYIWIVKDSVKGYDTLVSYGIDSNKVNSYLKSDTDDSHLFYRALRAVFSRGKYRVLRVKNTKYSNDLINDVKRVAIFPLTFNKKTEMALVVGVKDTRNLDTSAILLLKKITKLMSEIIEKKKAEDIEKIFKKELKIAAKTFESQEAIAITNAKGKIIRVNGSFSRITGYSEEDVLGKAPSVLKSGIHDAEFYKKMWSDIKSKGFWQGEIYNRRKNGEIYPELLSISTVYGENGKPMNYIAHFIDISEMKRTQEESEYRATHDPLTGVYNRQKLLDILNEKFFTKKDDIGLNAFYFIDLDNFKQINDYYGHEVGDEVLKEVVRRIKNSLEEDDIVARIAGDEFAVIATFKCKKTQIVEDLASQKAKNILKAFEEPFIYEDKTLKLDISIGIKLFPKEGDTPEDVISHADIAMYEVKRSGKGDFMLFNEVFAERLRYETNLRYELMKALENQERGEIKLYFQPKMRLKENSLMGMEALVRWEHPKFGLLNPSKFLKLTQGNRIGLKLNEYIINLACKHLVDWNEKYKDFPFQLSINLSGDFFNRPDFIEYMENTLSKYDINYKNLDFEIVEDALLKNFSHTVRIIEHFKAKGIHFSIDDFGTGYSSLNYLNQLPVDALKIDKSFVMNLSDSKNAQLVKMSIETANIFGLDSIAEGIESKEILDTLIEYGCIYGQGYYFSKPIPKERFEKEWIDKFYSPKE